MDLFTDTKHSACIVALKGKYHANLLSFQNPKMFVCQQKQRNNCQVCYTCKLPPSAIKLSISASGQRRIGRYGLKLEKC